MKITVSVKKRSAHVTYPRKEKEEEGEGQRRKKKEGRGDGECEFLSAGHEPPNGTASGTRREQGKEKKREVERRNKKS